MNVDYHRGGHRRLSGQPQERTERDPPRGTTDEGSRLLASDLRRGHGNRGSGARSVQARHKF